MTTLETMAADVQMILDQQWCTPLSTAPPTHTAVLMAQGLLDAGYGTKAEAWDEGFTACARQHMRQRDNSEHPITRANPHMGPDHTREHDTFSDGCVRYCQDCEWREEA